MEYEYELEWVEKPAERVKFREQAHTYKCQNQELLLGRRTSGDQVYFPTVRLVPQGTRQLIEGTKVRLSLVDVNSISGRILEHWHKLVDCRKGPGSTAWHITKEIDGQGSVIFNNIGIVKTQNKERVDTVSERIISRRTEKGEHLDTWHRQSIRDKAEQETKQTSHLKLKLCIEAFVVAETGIVRVAKTIFSDQIQDLNNHISGDLNITKISICQDRCSGGAEMMIFLEKTSITRSAFRAEFYQLQEGENPRKLWIAHVNIPDSQLHKIGTFLGGLYFNVPPFPSNITSPTENVFFEIHKLEKAKGAPQGRSAPLMFTYRPDPMGENKRPAPDSLRLPFMVSGAGGAVVQPAPSTRLHMSRPLAKVAKRHDRQISGSGGDSGNFSAAYSPNQQLASFDDLSVNSPSVLLSPRGAQAAMMSPPQPPQPLRVSPSRSFATPSPGLAFPASSPSYAAGSSSNSSWVQPVFESTSDHQKQHQKSQQRLFQQPQFQQQHDPIPLQHLLLTSIGQMFVGNNSPHAEQAGYVAVGNSSPHAEQLGYLAVGHNSPHGEQAVHMTVGHRSPHAEQLGFMAVGHNSPHGEQAVQMAVGHRSPHAEQLGYLAVGHNSPHGEQAVQMAVGHRSPHAQQQGYMVAGNSGLHTEVIDPIPTVVETLFEADLIQEFPGSFVEQEEQTSAASSSLPPDFFNDLLFDGSDGGHELELLGPDRFTVLTDTAPGTAHGTVASDQKDDGRSRTGQPSEQLADSVQASRSAELTVTTESGDDNKASKDGGDNSASREGDIDSALKDNNVNRASRKGYDDSASRKGNVGSASRNGDVDNASKDDNVNRASRKGDDDSASRKGDVGNASRDGDVDNASKDDNVNRASRKGDVDRTSRDGDVDSASKSDNINRASRKGDDDSASRDGDVDNASKDGADGLEAQLESLRL